MLGLATQKSTQETPRPPHNHAQAAGGPTAGATRGDHRAPATVAHSTQPGGQAKLKIPSCAARGEGEEGAEGHARPTRACARETRDSEEEACGAGTCTVAHAKRKVAGGARARAHAGTRFFEALNTPVQCPGPSPPQSYHTQTDLHFSGRRAAGGDWALHWSTTAACQTRHG